MTEMEKMGAAAKVAARSLIVAGEKKNDALKAIAKALVDGADKIIGLYPPIFVFVLAGYEHCVANMFYIPAGLFAASEYSISANGLTWGAFFIKNLLPVTLGNVIGGALLVGVGYWFAYLKTGKNK